MSTLKAISGYCLAFFALPLVLATFIGMESWMNLVTDAGLRVSPWYTGDAVVYTVRHGGYETRIHKPVFMGLIGETPEGFVQVDWTPREDVPVLIDEEIDYNGDGQADFRVQWDTSTGGVVITPHASEVLGLEGSYQLDAAWAVRIRLRNSSP